MDSTSTKILSLISAIDRYGAEEWNLRVVAATSAILFLGIRMHMGRKWQIEWDSFIHAIITGIGGLICIYLNANASFHMTGMQEPARSVVECKGPLTSLHRIIPAITQGYALCDILQGYHLLSKEGLGPEFLAHGFGTLIVATVFTEFEASHMLSPMLVLEGSTIILALLRADFLSPKMQIGCQAAFVLLYFLCRIIMFPYILIQALAVGYHSIGDCFPKSLFNFCLLFGALFNCLNIFWFVKVVRKVKRKLSGIEPITCMNRK